MNDAIVFRILWLKKNRSSQGILLRFEIISLFQVIYQPWNVPYSVKRPKFLTCVQKCFQLFAYFSLQILWKMSRNSGFHPFFDAIWDSILYGGGGGQGKFHDFNFYRKQWQTQLISTPLNGEKRNKFLLIWDTGGHWFKLHSKKQKFVAFFVVLPWRAKWIASFIRLVFKCAEIN